LQNDDCSTIMTGGGLFIFLATSYRKNTRTSIRLYHGI
jgi:hypothetical protein